MTCRRSGRELRVELGARRRQKRLRALQGEGEAESDGDLLDSRRQRDDGDRGSSGQRAVDAGDGQYRCTRSKLRLVRRISETSLIRRKLHTFAAAVFRYSDHSVTTYPCMLIRGCAC